MPRPSHRAVLVAILVLAVAVRAYRLTAQSLWFDEGVAVNAALQPDLAGVVSADPTNPPLYFVILHAVTRLAGSELLVLRWTSLLVGLIGVASGTLLARRLFGARAALFAAFLLAVSPLLWWASQEVRMYALMAALVPITALAWNHVSRWPSREAWLVLWAAELMLLYSHSTGPVVALWLNAATVLAWLVRRSLQRPPWLAWLLGQAAVALLWSPWFALRFVLLPAANRGAGAAPPLAPALLAQLWQALWAGAWGMVGQEPALAWLAALLFVLAVALIPWRDGAARWLVVHALLIVAGLVAALQVVGLGLHARYLVIVAPLVLVALAAGLARLSEARAARGRPLPAGAPAALALAPFVAALGLSLWATAATPGYGHDDVAGMVRDYAATLGPDDTVFAWAYTGDRYDLAYYWDRLGVQARRVILPESAGLAAIAPRLQSTGAVELSYWFAQRADQRLMLPCLLGHAGAEPPALRLYVGLGSARYPQAPAALPPLEPLQATFAVARVTALGARPAFTADRALCLPVEIELGATTARPLKAALIAHNALGWEIARAEALFAQADQSTSDRLPPGARLAAFPLLRLPYGAPPGDYPLVLRLYSDDALAGYDVLGGAGTPAGKDLALGAWSVQPAAWGPPPADALPVALGHASGPELELVAHDAQPLAPLRNGGRLRVSLLWRGRAELPALTLAADDASWTFTAPPVGPARANGVTLDWRELVVPAGAASGPATLALPDGTVLATYTIEALPAAFVEPPFATRAGAQLPGIGELIGFTLANTELRLGDPISITLVWRAGDSPPATAHKVFVHLLSPDGRLLAQSDAEPAQGTRPVTGWRPGEYVVDTHELAFHPDATPGPAYLQVGLYDPVSGERVRFVDGRDAWVLPGDVNVVGR